MHSRAGTQLKSAHSMQALRNASGTWRYAVRSQAPSSVVGARVATKAAPGSTDEVRLKDIVKQIADETEIVQKDVDTICRSFIKCVEDTVAAGGKVQLTGFGTFKRSVRAARQGRNPSNGEAISIPETAAATFSAGKGFKDHVKQAYKK